LDEPLLILNDLTIIKCDLDTRGGYRGVGGISGGWGFGPFWLAPDRADGDLGGVEKLRDVVLAEDLHDGGLRDAGDVVADVVESGERGHGAEKGPVARLLGLEFAFIGLELLLVGAMPGANAARDGGVVEGTIGSDRLGFFGR